MRSKRLIYFFFFLSGAAGLMYEIIWTRFFSLTFGATTYSITTVLTAFMAGLALGSFLLGKVADRIQKRLVLYGWIELLIGIYALFFPFIFHLSSRFYLYLVGSGALDPMQKLYVKFALSFLIMLVPTTLMGGSLPVLSRYFIKDLKDVSSKLGILYAVNTFGAVVGTYLVGFHLLSSIGLNASILVAAVLNIGIGIAIILYAWKSKETDSATGDDVLPTTSGSPTRQGKMIIIFAVSAFMISGFVSLSHEVVWTRILSLIIGSSTYAFTMILIGFLIGIALGSYLVSYTKLIPNERVNLLIFSAIEIGIGLSAYILIPLFSKLPYIMLKAFQINPDSYNFITFSQFVLVLLVVIIPTTLMGATLPVIGKIVSKEVRSVGGTIGNIYFFNTFGAIFGSFFAGFLFIPYLGTLNTLKLGIGINLLLGIGGLLLATYQQKQRWALIMSLLVAGTGLTGVWFTKWDAGLMDSGVSIYGPSMAEKVKKEKTLKDGSEVVYFQEGVNATITVRKGENTTFLKSNGKIDASTTRADMTTFTFTGYLPMMLHQNPQNALVIGLGSGATAWTVGQYDSIKSLDIVEIEPSIVEAASFFKGVNYNILADPKTRMFINDGRNYLLETKEKYDLIISEPSNPWISGIASLYTIDFFKIVREKLKPEGVFCQWIHVYSMSLDNLKMVLKTVALSFEDIQLWVCDSGDLLIIASDKKIGIDPKRINQVMNFSNRTKKDFSKYLLATYPMELLGRLFLDKQGVLEFSRGARINSDDIPYLEYFAPRDLYRRKRDKIHEVLSEWTEKKEPLAIREIKDARNSALINFHRSKVYTDIRFMWFEKGKQYIQKALAQDDTLEDLHLQLGKILLREKDYLKAEEAITTGLEINKTSAGIQLYANFLISTGKDTEALTVFEQEKDLFKNYERLYGEKLFVRGLYEQAIPYLEESLKKKQKQGYLLMERLGMSYQAIGQLEVAEKYYIQSIEKEKMNPRSHYYLARLYGEQKRYKEAHSIFLFLRKYWDEASLRNLEKGYRNLNLRLRKP